MNLRNVSIPAAGSSPGIISVRVGGLDSVFFAVSADGVFRVQPDSQASLQLYQGQGFGTPGQNQYSRLTFFNDSGAVVNVSFYTGDQPFQNTAAVSTVGSITVSQKEPASYLKASGTLTLGAGANTSYPGTDSGKQRKQVVVTNLHASLILKVRTSTPTVFATVFPGSAWTVETNATINVYNPGGSAVDYEVGEIYYA